MKTICVYHSRDLDGWMSAAIVKKWFIEITKAKNKLFSVCKYEYRNDVIRNNNAECLDMLGWDYGNIIPDLSNYNKIIMVDISFSAKEMINLYKMYKDNFIWIDHHISAINDIKMISDKGNVPIVGLRDVVFAACEICWMYLYPNDKLPEIIRLLGMYDSFRHKGTEEEQKVLEFQYGARQLIINYNDAYKYLVEVSSNNTNWGTLEIANNGHYIYNYLKVEAKQVYKNSFNFTFYPKMQNDGSLIKPINFLMVNKERFNPINFDINYHNDGYDGFACFWYNNNKWNFTLYNDNGNIDCSKLAKQYGGGGHKGAAGFIINNINDFLITNK